MNFYQILPLFVAPAFLFFFIFYLKFKFRIRNYRNIILALILGILSSLVLIFSYEFFKLFNLHNVSNIRRTIFFAFVITAFSSELGKFLVLFYGFFKKKEFFGPIESIIYSLFISMGFTLTTSILYVAGFISPLNNLLFLYIYGISNLVFAILLGFFVGLGKSRKNNLIDSMTGLFASTFFHGVLNFCILTKDYKLLLLVGIASVIISVVLIIKSLDYKQIINNQTIRL